ncbi:MAG: phosphate regulon transcriptional regulator PhoB [Pseudomonadota bacterium]
MSRTLGGTKPVGDQRILIVEDEQAIREMTAFGLRRAGFEVAQAEDCRGARSMIADKQPDLILLDWMLPEMSGLKFVRSLKKDSKTSDIPVIMLTARSQEEDKVKGLDSGADDYITKPFSARELNARVRALLRRAAPSGDAEVLKAEALELDLPGHRVTAHGKPVQLGPTEFKLLKFFMSHQDRVYSRTQLLDRVWGGNVYVEERTVDVHIRRLRKALSEHGCDSYIQTVRGAGYRFSVKTE